MIKNIVKSFHFTILRKARICQKGIHLSPVDDARSEQDGQGRSVAALILLIFFRICVLVLPISLCSSSHPNSVPFALMSSSEYPASLAHPLYPKHQKECRYRLKDSMCKSSRSKRVSVDMLRLLVYVQRSD
jgi:hypothetical protein